MENKISLWNIKYDYLRKNEYMISHMSLPEDDFDRLLQEEREIRQEENNIESFDMVNV